MAKAAEAVIAGARLDAHRLRADFPIFEQRFHGKPLAYLDSAVSAQKPRQVLDALRDFYETSYTNVNRGVYLLAERREGDPFGRAVDRDARLRHSGQTGHVQVEHLLHFRCNC